MQAEKLRILDLTLMKKISTITVSGLSQKTYLGLSLKTLQL
jgi:hypothetical protein